MTGDDQVDEAGLRRLTRYLIDAGVNGLLVNGSMGGFAFLTDEEQLRAVSIVVDESRGSVPVIGCVGETGTHRAIRKAKQIEQCGASYLSVLPPFYFFTAQVHLVRYFSDIASAVDLPLLLYDNPVMTKNQILPETIADLRRRIPRIVGIKESNQDCVNLQSLLDLTRDDEEFCVLTGSESLILVGLQMGCAGMVGGLHNLCPHLAVGLYRSFCEGNFEAARTFQRQLISALDVFRYGNIWGGFDEALRYLGIADRATGSPYRSDVSVSEADSIHRILDRFAKPYFSSRSAFEATPF